jgi:hypothetical protein
MNNNHDIVSTKIKKSDFIFGKMKDTITIKGNILEPIDIDREENISGTYITYE